MADLEFLNHERLIKPNRFQELTVLFNQHRQNVFSTSGNCRVDVLNRANYVGDLLMLEFGDLVKFGKVFVGAGEKEQQIRSGVLAKLFK